MSASQTVAKGDTLDYNRSMKTPLLILVLAAVAAALFFRFDVQTNDRGVAYKLDRWTGGVTFIQGPSEVKASSLPPPTDWSNFKPDPTTNR